MAPGISDNSSMFIRTKSDPDRNLFRVQIVHNARVNGKVRQKVLRHVGSCRSRDELEPLYTLAALIMDKLQQGQSSQMHLLTPAEYVSLLEKLRRAGRNRTAKRLGVNLTRCQEIIRVMVGFHEVFSEYYRDFGWEQLLGASKQGSNRGIKELVMACIWQPRSMQVTVGQMQAEAGIALNLDQVYQAMDDLDAPCIERIRDACFDQARTLFKQPVGVLFCDLTTLYFESEHDDELRRMGYSKDGKSNRVQVVLALIINEAGLPVGYEAFPGNTFEGNTLEPVIERMRARYQVPRITLVDDSTLISQANQSLLRELGMDCILSYRLESAPKAIKEKILDRDRYRDDPSSEAGDLCRYQVIEDGDNRIVVTYSAKRARKDQKNRKRSLTRLRRRLGKSGTLKSMLRGEAARYLSVDQGQAVIDEDKVRQQARWDGLWALTASGNAEMSPAELVHQYHQLGQIEHGFWTNKHNLRVKSVSHWTPSRIQAHLAICFMACCLVEHLRYRLKVIGNPMSVQEICEHLSRLQFSILKHLDSDACYALPSPISDQAKCIYRILGLQWFPYPFKLDSS